MPWGAVAGAVVSAGIGAATKSASGGSIAGGAAGANGLSQASVAEAKELYKPYIDTGRNALTTYGDLSGLGGPEAGAAAMAKFTASPGYGYQVSEGLKAVDAGAAAKGMLRSGATLKAEQTLGANLANQDFGAYMGRLNTLANFGMNGTNGYTNVMNGQSNNQQATTASAASKEASIYDSMGTQIGNTANSIGKELTTNYRDTGSIWGAPANSNAAPANDLFSTSYGYGGVSGR